jgi:hypothetical protein
VQAIPADVPILDPTDVDFDLERFLNNFERFMKGYRYQQAAWVHVLSLRIADDQLAVQFANAQIRDWSAAKTWWHNTIPQSDRSQRYFDELIDLRQGAVEINAHNTKFNILATRAKFHDDGNLARLYLRSLNPAVRQRLWRDAIVGRGRR